MFIKLNAVSLLRGVTLEFVKSKSFVHNTEKIKEQGKQEKSLNMGSRI